MTGSKGTLYHDSRQPQNILHVWPGLVKHLISIWEAILSCWQCCGGGATPYLFG